jgi:hypothetical protein
LNVILRQDPDVNLRAATSESFGAVFSAKGAASTASLGQRPRFMAAKEHQR